MQRTDYPWKGEVEIAVNPAAARRRSRCGCARRTATSARSIRAAPAADGIVSLAVNGKPVKPEIEDGYAVITRKWKAGDTVRLELPLRVQRVKADERIVADRGRVALRYGPLSTTSRAWTRMSTACSKPDAPLTAEWEPDLLGGVVAIRGAFADGSPLTAIPNYARNNRGGRSIVWIGDPDRAVAAGGAGGARGRPAGCNARTTSSRSRWPA